MYKFNILNSNSKLFLKRSIYCVKHKINKSSNLEAQKNHSTHFLTHIIALFQPHSSGVKFGLQVKSKTTVMFKTWSTENLKN